MATIRPPRELQALREVGRTAVRPWLARALAVAFLATAGVVPSLELAGVAGSGSAVPSGSLVARVGGALAEARLLAANRMLLEEIERIEAALDERSLLQRVVVPYAQWAETRILADGNRRALLGEDGWLFYRPDLEHVVGRPFLDPAVLAARSAGGASWRRPPHPDPRPAIRDFRDQLAQRGVELLVVPTPVKPMVEPERFAAGVMPPADAPLRNASFDRFMAALEAAGVAVFDPGPLLVGDGREDLYLVADTHWTPEAMEEVAQSLATAIERRIGAPDEPVAFRRRPVAVRGTGDIARMLQLPPATGLFPPQEVTSRMVLTPDGSLWRPERGAAVLLLGDSFTNVYSQDGLGWGQSAGLAEQLAYFLGRPVDRIAVNAGGSHTTREALARALRSDPGRLEGVRLVVYQFAARELSHGDWRPVDLLSGTGRESSEPRSRPSPRAPHSIPEGPTATVAGRRLVYLSRDPSARTRFLRTTVPCTTASSPEPDRFCGRHADVAAPEGMR